DRAGRGGPGAHAGAAGHRRGRGDAGAGAATVGLRLHAGTGLLLRQADVARGARRAPGPGPALLAPPGRAPRAARAPDHRRPARGALSEPAPAALLPRAERPSNLRTFRPRAYALALRRGLRYKGAGGAEPGIPARPGPGAPLRTDRHPLATGSNDA